MWVKEFKRYILFFFPHLSLEREHSFRSDAFLVSQGSFPDCHLFVKYNLDYCLSEGNWLWSLFCFISLEMMKCYRFQNEDGHLIFKQSNYCSITRYSESIHCPAARTHIQNKSLISQVVGEQTFNRSPWVYFVQVTHSDGPAVKIQLAYCSCRCLKMPSLPRDIENWWSFWKQ